MSVIISSALPIFSVIAIGFLFGRLGYLKHSDTIGLNRFAFVFAMPMALFGLTAQTSLLTTQNLTFGACYAFAALTMMAVAFVIARRIFALSPQDAGGFALASVLGNAVFLGLSIALTIPGWAEKFAVAIIFEWTVVLTIGAYYMSSAQENEKSIFDGLKKLTRNPLIIAILAGITYSTISLLLTGQSVLPAPIAKFTGFAGQAAGPVALFSLGVFLATMNAPPARTYAREIAVISFIKLFATPLLLASTLTLVGMGEAEWIGPAVLFTAMPTAVGAYILASEYKHYTMQTAATILVTTTISVITVSMILMLFA